MSACNLVENERLACHYSLVHGGRRPHGQSWWGGAVVGLAALMLTSAVSGCSRDYDRYESESSLNIGLTCPVNRLTALFKAVEAVPTDGSFAYIINGKDIGNSSTMLESANVAVVVIGNHVDLAVFNSRALKDGNTVPVDVMPLVSAYENALIDFGCRRGSERPPAAT